MTIRELQKAIESQSDYYSSQQSEMLDKLRGKSFYYWDHNEHNGASKSRKNKNDCCFNHIIGLPTKDGVEKPLFDYEREIYFALLRPGYLNSYPSNNQSNIKPDNVLFPFKEKHLWIKKAIKDLQKLIESQPDHDNPQQSQLERLRDKAFWHWDRGEHIQKDKSSKGDCCFNHIIGLPRKDGKRKPLFDYEGMLYRALLKPGYFISYPSAKSKDIPSDNVMYPFKEKHLWILKSTGLGVSEFFLRFMAWLLAVFSESWVFKTCSV